MYIKIVSEKSIALQATIVVHKDFYLQSQIIKNIIILQILTIHDSIFTFSRQAFNESLAFCNRS